MLFLIGGQVTVGVFLLGFGLWYAWVIYRAPIDRTHVEVFWGVLGTLAGVGLAHLVIWEHYGYLPWWAAFWPILGFILTGGPQLLFQEYKYRQMKEEAGDVKNRRNNNNGETKKS